MLSCKCNQHDSKLTLASVQTKIKIKKQSSSSESKVQNYHAKVDGEKKNFAKRKSFSREAKKEEIDSQTRLKLYF